VSLFPTYSNIWPYAGPGPTVEVPAARDATPPKGERQPRNARWGGAFGPLVNFAGAFMQWTGEGFTPPPRSAWSTYRLMDLHPTLAKCRATYYGRLLSSKWDWKKREDSVSDRWLKAVKEQFDPLRHRVIGEALRALTFGHRGFQKVWGTDGGRLVIEDLIAYEPEEVAVCHVEGRPHEFGGLAFNHDKTDVLRPNKAWLFNIDGWGGNLNGAPYHDAAYDVWCDWNRGRWARIGVGKKLSGILPILKFPPGTSNVSTESGQGSGTVENDQIARQILAALGLGNGVAIPSFGFENDEIANEPALAKATPWDLDFYDAGSHSTATGGIVGAQEYDDKQLCRAWRLSERALIEATTSGSRADSEQHTETDVLQLEAVDNEIARQFSAGVVDDYLVLNYGEKARGAITCEPTPLADKKSAVYLKHVEAVNADPVMGPVFRKSVDTFAVCEHLGIPAEKDINELLDEAADAVPGEAAGGLPPDLAEIGEGLNAAAAAIGMDRAGNTGGTPLPPKLAQFAAALKRMKAGGGAPKPGANGTNGKAGGRLAELSRGVAWLDGLANGDGED
jgi:hypothetical protein